MEIAKVKNMKTKPFIFILLILLSISSVSLAQNKRAARETVWELLEENNPDGYYFMTSLYELPSDFKFGNLEVMLSEETDFMEYVDHYKIPEILDDMATAVHEACHGYESRKPYAIIEAQDIPFDFEDSYSVYFVSRDEEYMVRQSATFPSREMMKDIPEKYKTFRFDTYINTRSEYLGTQQKGIFGLMDEFTAYYNGFKTIVLNFPEYQRYAERNAINYLHYLEHAASHKAAYYEFTYFILHYLSHASIHYPDMYHSFLNNKDLKLAYQSISHAYKEIIDTYEDNIQEIRKDVEARGEYFSYDEESIWIGNTGIGTFSEDEMVLKEAIGSIKYWKIVEALYSL